MTFKSKVILSVLGNKLYVLFISASTLTIAPWSLGVCPFGMIIVFLNRNCLLVKNISKQFKDDIFLKLFSKLSYEDLNAYIHQYYSGNVDNIRAYELQFVKASPPQFVSETLKCNVLRNLKRKYVINNIPSSLPSLVRNSLGIQSFKINIQSSASSSIKKIKSSYNVKHSKQSTDESCNEKFLKASRIWPVCVCIVCSRCLYKSNVALFNKGKV